MLKEKLCLAYVTNSRGRKSIVERWEKLLNAMPIGVSMRATEIAKKANEGLPFDYYSHHNIPPMVRAIQRAYGGEIIKKQVIPCEPYTIMIDGIYNWSTHEWINQKPKVIDKVTVYTRLK